MADEIFVGETHDYSTYIYDEQAGAKESPVVGINYNDIIIFLFMDYNNELVQVYSTTGAAFTRDGIEYAPKTLTIVGDDMEFTIEAADTQGKGTGNIIIQIDTIGLDGTTTTKYQGVLGKVIEAL